MEVNVDADGFVSQTPADTTELAAEASKPSLVSKQDVEELVAVKLMFSPNIDLTTLRSEAEAELHNTQDREVLYGEYFRKSKSLTKDAVVQATRTALKSGAHPESVIGMAVAANQWVDGMGSADDAQMLLNTAAANMSLPDTRSLTLYANMSAYKRIEDLRKERGTESGWDAAGSVAGLILMGDSTLDAEDAAKRLGYKEFNEMVQAYQAMNPFEKANVWKPDGKWAEAVFDATNGNHLKAANVVQKLQAWDSESQQRWDLAFDVLVGVDYAGMAYGVSKIARKGKAAISAEQAAQVEAERTMSAAGRLQAAGSDQGAADAVLSAAAAGGEDEVLNAAKAASPFNYTGTVVDNAGTIDGVAPEILSRLAQNKAAVHEDEFLAEAERLFREDVAVRLELDAENLSGVDRGTYNSAKAELRMLDESISSGEYTGVQLKELKANADRLRKTINDFGQAQRNVMRAGRVRKGGKLAGPELQALKKQQAALRKVLREAPESPASAGDSARLAEIERIEAELQLKLDGNAETLRARGGKAGIEAELKAAKDAHAAEAVRIASLRKKGLLTADEAEEALLESSTGRKLKEVEELHKSLKGQRGLAVELAKLRSRDFSPAVRARLRAITEKAAAEQAAKLGQPAAKQLSGPQATATDPALSRVVDSGKQTEATPLFKSSSPTMQGIINESVNGVRDFIRPFASGDAFISAAKHAHIRDTITKEMLAGKNVIKAAEVVATDGNKFRVRYKTANGSEVREYEWSLDSAGNWNTAAIGASGSDLGKLTSAASSNLLTPTTNLRKLDRDIVANLTIGSNQAAAIYNRIAKRLGEINSEMSNAERLRVEDLLMRGDEAGVRYEVDDLLAGNIAVRADDGSLQLGAYTVNEVNAYVKLRTMYDELFNVQNEAAYRHFSFLKAEELHIADGGRLVLKETKKGAKDIPGGSMQTMVFRVTDEAKLSVVGAGTDGERVLVAVGDKSEYRVMSGDEVSAMRAQGAEVFKFHSHRDIDGHVVKHVLVIPDGNQVKIAPLRRQVLQYAEGYVPRIYKPGHVFVKDTKTFSTVAGFDGLKAANRWIAEQRTIAAAKGEDFRLAAYEDRALPPDEIELERLNSFGGLFYRPRSPEPIKDPTTGQTIERFDVAEATQMYLAGIADMLPLAEYRGAVVRQFSDAVNAVAKENGRPHGFRDINDMRSPIETGDASADAVLENAREYLFKQLQIPSAEERRAANLRRSMINYMEGRPLFATARKFLRNNPNLSADAAIKTTVFHAYLGCFNPRQLVIQAQNATIAMRAYPQHALPAYLDYLKMRTVLFLRNDEIIELSKRSGLKFDDAKEQAALLRRSGYLDSIFRNSDYAGISAGLTGTTAKVAKNLKKASTLPFMEGELAARMMAFNIATRRWRAANPGTKAVDDTALHEILQDSLRLSMNLQRENAAKWQDAPVVGVATQFLQVQAKFWENVVGGLLHNTGKDAHTGWSRKEAAQIAAGEIVFYGTVSTVGASWLAGRGKEVVADNTQAFNAQHPMAAEAVDEGALGLLLKTLGFNIVATEDLGLWAGLDETVVWHLAEAVGEVLAGHPSSVELGSLAPVAGVASRAGTAVGNIGSKLLSAAGSEPMTFAVLTESLDDLARVASSWNNYQKRMFIDNTGLVITKAGVPLIAAHESEMNWQTRLADSIGFDTEAEHNTYDAIKTNREYNQLLEGRKTMLRQSIMEKIAGRSASATALNSAALADLTPTEQAEIITEVLRDLTKRTVEQSAEQKLFQRYMEGRSVNPDVNIPEMLSD